MKNSPPQKRRKISKDETQQLDEKEIYDKRGQLREVLGEEELRTLELEEAVAAVIPNPKQTSGLIKFLVEKFPLDSLRHLKRIKREGSQGSVKLKVLIAAKDLFEKYPIEDKKVLLEEYGLTFESVQVPKHCPKTPKQSSDWKKVWPTVLLDLKQTTPPSSLVFSDQDLVKLEEAMLLAIEEAKKAKEQGNQPIGAVMLNKKRSIVCESGDCRSKSPLNHAIMRCISKVAEIDLDKFPKDSKEYPEKDYLCTGYICVTTREPCCMCSMALLHSRIFCVVYGTRNKEGGLGSRFKMHCFEPFNHHFFVYEGFLGEICGSLWDS